MTPPRALFLAASTTALTIVALGLAALVLRGVPLALRLPLGTLLAVGGVSTLTRLLLPVRPVRGRVDRATLSLAVLAGVGLALFGSGALIVEYAWVPALRPGLDAKAAMFDAVLRPSEWGAIPYVFVAVALIPGVLEEFLFRGILRDLTAGLRRASRVLALGLLFSLMHGDPTVLLPMIWVGAMLTLIAEFTGGWAAAAAAHVALNAFNGVVVPRLPLGTEMPSVEVGAAMLVVGSMLAVAAVGRMRPPLANVSGDKEPDADDGDTPAS